MGIRLSETRESIGLSNVQNILNNYSATTDPVATNDTNEGYSVGSRWVNINTDTVFSCVDASAGTAIWKTEASVFGLNYQYSESLGESQTTSTNPVTKVSLTTPALTGTYMLWYTCDANNLTVGERFRIRIVNTTDSINMGRHDDTSQNSSDDIRISGFDQVVFTGAAKTFELQFEVLSTGTVKINSARLALWRVA